MGDLGLPGSVVEMADDAPQKNLWEVRKAGLNIMMSLKGDGKPVSFIEDCAVPLEHLAEYTDALTEVFAQARHARHLVRARLGRHAACAADPRHAPRRRRARCARSPRKRPRWCASSRAPTAASTATACAAANGSRGSSGPAINDAFRAIKHELDPIGLFNPGKIIDPPKMDDPSLFRYRPGYRTIALTPVLDWSAWDVQNDPLTEAITAPGTGGDPTGGFAKAVEMCNNNGHCRKFDAGTMCPSYRVTRDEQHLTRGRANTLRLALSGQLGADALLTSDAVHEALDLCVGCKGCKRECPTGVDMAKMKIEFLAPLHAAARPHAEGPADRRSARLRASREPLRVAAQSARSQCRGARGWAKRWLGFSARRTLPRWRRDTFCFSAARRAATREAMPGAAEGRWCCSSTPSTALRDARTRSPRCACCRPPATRSMWRPSCCPTASTCAAAAPTSPAGMVDEAKAKAARAGRCAAALRREGHRHRRPGAVVPVDAARRNAGDGPGRSAAQPSARQALLFEEFLAREAQAGPLRSASRLRSPAKRDAAARPLPPEGVRRGAADPRGAAADPGRQARADRARAAAWPAASATRPSHYDVSMQMAELSLLPAVRKRPIAIDRRRRHQLPAPDRRRRRARGKAAVFRPADPHRRRAAACSPGRPVPAVVDEPLVGGTAAGTGEAGPGRAAPAGSVAELRPGCPRKAWPVPVEVSAASGKGTGGATAAIQIHLARRIGEDTQLQDLVDEPVCGRVTVAGFGAHEEQQTAADFAVNVATDLDARLGDALDERGSLRHLRR